jgi:hypothetical protein
MLNSVLYPMFVHYLTLMNLPGTYNVHLHVCLREIDPCLNKLHYLGTINFKHKYI